MIFRLFVRRKKYILYFFTILVLYFLFKKHFVLTTIATYTPDTLNAELTFNVRVKKNVSNMAKPNVYDIINKGIVVDKKIEVTKSYKIIKTDNSDILSYKVHTFYYPWYGNPTFDKDYYHWNHKYLPSWRKNSNSLYPTGYHIPPGDIGSNFYPALGAYSSSDPDVIEDHMKQCKTAGIGVLSVSYYPPGQGDDNGKDWQNLLPLLLDIARKYGIKITFHIEPYKKRSPVSVKSDLQHIISTYSKHSAFYMYFDKNRKKNLPLIYIYDSYNIKQNDWKTILQNGTDSSIRNTWYDAFIIGLVVDRDHLKDILLGGFDGFYTYFATDGFTFGSTRNNWSYMSGYAKNHNLFFIPSVGPGYIDTRIRPWNGENTRFRLNGKYYKESWIKAIEVGPPIISITSFNEWHEGSQIEKAIPKEIDNFKYLNYKPHSPDYYLISTKQYIELFNKMHSP